MSWDIILFNSKNKIELIEDLKEEGLEAIDFCDILENHFTNITNDGNHRTIKGLDYSIEYFIDDEPISNKMLSLYGENGLYELVLLSKKYGWQIFDTSLGQMINLDSPDENGYDYFISFLNQIKE